MPSFREFTATERNVFHFLHVTPGREDEVHLAALLSVWLSRFVFWAIGDEIRPMVFKVASYMATGVRFFALAVLPWPAFTKVWDTPAAGWPSMARWPYLYTWLAVYFFTRGEDLEHCSPLWRLDLPPSGERDPSRDRGPLQLIILGGRPTCRHYFSDEDYDSDRSHPRKRRPKGKRPVGASSASKKRAPLTILADASGSASKKKKARKEVPPASFPPSPPTFLPPIPETEPPTSCPSENPPIETVQILSSPEAPVAPQEEASVVGELAEITPSEGLPVQEVAPSPSVVQEEAVIEAEALPPAVEEEDTTPAVEVPAIEAAVEVIQEEVPTTEGALETIVAPEEAVMEVAPAAEEVSLVQATPPTSSSLTPSQTPSQEFLSYIKGLMVQAWRDRIVPRMLSPGVVSDISLLADAGFAISRLQEMGHDVTRLRVYTQQLQTLQEIEPSAGEKVRPDFRGMRRRVLLETLWP
ncbi:hypothetical protein H6P81_002684 [Aristolochia fimbriata]|uniref:Aminotransferase-like plant mobile domain-containing protein n=1 Tax=Aristolochia fimbriata TaxID=158543 RepID=A0AAV7FEA9_ARIFI|nr:hypothetical protein H6P81_002684 [Aristolochia fimbriata]